MSQFCGKSGLPRPDSRLLKEIYEGITIESVGYLRRRPCRQDFAFNGELLSNNDTNIRGMDFRLSGMGANLLEYTNELMKKRHLIIGVLFWAAATAAGWLALRAELTSQSSSLANLSGEVSEWLSHRRQMLQATSEQSLAVALDDPIFLQSDNGEYRQVGVLVNVDGRYVRDPMYAKEFKVVIYDDAIAQFDPGFQLEYHTTPMSLDWVVKTMIPPERQKQIAEFIATEWKAHQKEIMTELKPVLKSGIQKAMKAVEAELPDILRAHRPRFQALGDRYETEILKEEIVPLVKEEILPIVEKEAVPVAEEVGRALWNRVSLWSFAWRYVFDQSPLPRKNRVKEEFQRFIDEEALPELRGRSDQFIDVTETIVKRSMENPRVKEVLKRNLKRVAEDPELHAIVWSVVREAVVENDMLRKSLEAYMNEHQTKAAMKLAGTRMEPLVRSIGDMIFGTREKGITPEFSRILRSQILRKDRRWFVMVPGQSAEPAGQVRVFITNNPMIYPMGFGGTDQSPLTPESN